MADTKIVSYKGHNYRLLWEGKTKYGIRAKLGFKEFWVNASAVSDASGASKATPERSRSYECSECGECGEYVVPGSECWETGMRH